MKKDISMKKLYLFTITSIITTFLFLYIFSETATYWYTGWDKYTNKNTLSTFADIMFMILLLTNCAGIVLSMTYTGKSLLNKFREDN